MKSHMIAPRCLIEREAKPALFPECFAASPKWFHRRRASPPVRWRRPDDLKVSAVTRKRWQVVPDSSTTSSRHSGLSLSLATVSRIMSEHAAAASSQAASSSGKSTRGVLE
jgi:hypothetical protein